VSVRTDPTTPAVGKPSRRAVLASGIGNFVEQYDFGVYGYLAPILAPLFFPGENPVAGLLATYGIYAISFVMRPLGGALFGMIGDRLGRRAMLALTVLLIGLFTGLIGALPTYAAAGIAAPVLLLVLRMLQGLAAGGEYSGAVGFMVEHAPRHRRGFFASFASLGVYLGLLSGAAMATLLTATLTHEQLTTWGWRLPFLVAIPLCALGLVLRLAVEESPEFERFRREQGAVEATPVRTTLRTQWRAILLYVGMTIGGSVSSYSVITYLPQHLINDVGLDSDAAFATSVIAMGVLLVTLPFTGLLVDVVGRKPVHLTAAVIYVVLPAIAYTIADDGTFGSALTAQLLFMIPVSLNSAVVTVLIPELFPTRVRATASGIGFNLSYGLFGGTAPLVGTALVAATGTVLSVAAYASAAALISLLVCVFCYRETRDVDLATAAVPAP
jgi:MFS transporter, MHS family, proline/betaine transporter